MVQQVSKIQTPYGCKTNMGLNMSASLELLIVELGVCISAAAARIFQEVQTLNNMNLVGLTVGEV